MGNKPDITIVGAGLVGSLFSLQMANKGHKVRVFEKRADMRKKITPKPLRRKTNCSTE